MCKFCEWMAWMMVTGTQQKLTVNLIIGERIHDSWPVWCKSQILQYRVIWQLNLFFTLLLFFFYISPCAVIYYLLIVSIIIAKFLHSNIITHVSPHINLVMAKLGKKREWTSKNIKMQIAIQTAVICALPQCIWAMHWRLLQSWPGLPGAPMALSCITDGRFRGYDDHGQSHQRDTGRGLAERHNPEGVINGKRSFNLIYYFSESCVNCCQSGHLQNTCWFTMQ